MEMNPLDLFISQVNIQVMLLQQNMLDIFQFPRSIIITYAIGNLIPMHAGAHVNFLLVSVVLMLAK